MFIKLQIYKDSKYIINDHLYTPNIYIDIDDRNIMVIISFIGFLWVVPGFLHSIQKIDIFHWLQYICPSWKIKSMVGESPLLLIPCGIASFGGRAAAFIRL